MKLTSRTLAVLVPAVFLIGIGGTAALNIWNTESDKVPARFESGEFSGEYNPGDIRGSYSFGDVERAFGIPAATIAQAFGFGAQGDPLDIQAKDLEEVYGEVEDREIGTDSLRYFVALWEGIPYQPEETTALPYQALSTLREEERIDEQTLAQLRTAVGVRPEAAGATSPGDDTDDADDTTVKGRTTFDEVLRWGLSQEQVEEAIGMAMGPRSMTIRDYLADKDVEFRTARESLQALIDRQ